jgi:hypothetical protein
MNADERGSETKFIKVLICVYLRSSVANILHSVHGIAREAFL